MAQTKSGTMGSNVLILEDIRNKKKRSAHTSNNEGLSRIVDTEHVSAVGADQINDPPDQLNEPKECSEPTPILQNSDTDVIKTPTKRSLVSNRRFDKVKVERLKAALADGSYEINFMRVAEKFIEHERFG